jgi:hypothetical protein
MLNFLRNLVIVPGAAGGAWGVLRLIERPAGHPLDFAQLGPAVLLIGIACVAGAFLGGGVLHCLLPAADRRY